MDDEALPDFHVAGATDTLDVVAILLSGGSFSVHVGSDPDPELPFLGRMNQQDGRWVALDKQFSVIGVADSYESLLLEVYAPLVRFDDRWG